MSVGGQLYIQQFSTVTGNTKERIKKGGGMK
jgi:hypothetical protein